MVNRNRSACLCLSALISSFVPLAPARADDAKTGFFAGLGFSAADGKTSLGAGAGTIEASLLVTDAVLMAGAQIRMLAASRAVQENRKTVLLLSHADTLDFTMARAVANRLASLKAALPTGICMVPKVVANTKSLSDPAGGGAPDAATPATTEAKKGLQKSDLAPALSTSISVNGITLTTDDRVLLNAVQIGASTLAWRPVELTASTAPAAAPRVSDSGVTFLLPGQIIDYGDVKASEENKVITNYEKLRTWATTNRSCDAPAYKTALETFDALEKSILASDKGPPPLSVAAELAPLAEKSPLTLRLAVEQVGGSAVARSNIWYAVGIPGAATVSAGLLVSFKLSDPVTGKDYLTGFVRCTVPPTGLRDVHKRLDPRSDTDRTKQEQRIQCGVLSS